MRSSASLLFLPLQSLPFATAFGASKEGHPVSQLVSAPSAAGPSPCGRRCRRRPAGVVRANEGGKGFGQLAKKKTTPSPTTNGCEDEENDEIPQVVFERMIGRILFYVGAPMATGAGLLYLLDRLKTNHVWDVPLWVPFMTILIGFGTSALGIAYGTLSTSWDSDKDGSLLGWEEAQKNWPLLWKEDEGTTSGR